MKRRPVGEEPVVSGALASVLPVNAKEVELLARAAERYSIPLVVLGAGTGPESTVQPGSVIVRFDLMRSLSLQGEEEIWARAEPGASWLELDNNLGARGRGLAVYPTSAPRATVGGWLALDGLGVGSFEYGWLSENVLSADVVLPGGERRTMRGEELRPFVGPGETAGIVVGATIRTRRADADVPFGVVFKNPEDLARTVAVISERGVPLWHLAFLDSGMARARGLGEDYLLFGAYPRERTASVEEALRGASESHLGRILPTAETYRVWGERFFPIAPSHPTPTSTKRTIISLNELAETLAGTRGQPADLALQGTVARAGEVLLLTFDAREEGWVS